MSISVWRLVPAAEVSSSPSAARFVALVRLIADSNGRDSRPDVQLASVLRPMPVSGDRGSLITTKPSKYPVVIQRYNDRSKRAIEIPAAMP